MLVNAPLRRRELHGASRCWCRRGGTSSSRRSPTSASSTGCRVSTPTCSSRSPRRCWRAPCSWRPTAWSWCTRSTARPRSGPPGWSRCWSTRRAPTWSRCSRRRSRTGCASELGAVAPEIVAMPNPLPQGFAPRSLLDSRTIVAAGRLVMEKQFTKLVQAFADVADQLPDWRLRILGQGHQRPHLVRETRKRGLWDRVELPGSTTDMPSEWAKASICALTSRAEGFPLGLQEAMAAGVPCVTFDCASGPREIVRHEVNGLLVAPESIAGMSAALLRLGTDDDLRHRLGAGALESRSRVGRRHDRRPSGSRSSRRRSPAGPAGRGSPRCRPPPAASRPRRRPTTRPASRPQRPGTPRSPWPSRPPGRRATEWLVIPPHETRRPVVVLPMAARRRFLQELAAADAPAYLSLRDPAANGWHERRAPVAALASDLLRGRTSMVAIEPWPTTDGRATPRCSARAARSRWSSGRRASTASSSRRRRNRYAQRLPRGAAKVTTDGRRHRRPHAAADGGADRARVHVPGRRRLHLGRRPRPGVEPGPRSTGWPAVRHGHDPGVERPGAVRLPRRAALLAAQRPPLRALGPQDPPGHRRPGARTGWTRRTRRSTLVDHAAILPPDALPTFNSHAIESALHRVPDLAEHFVYLNDDFFLGRPLGPETFFSPAGLAAVWLLPQHHRPRRRRPTPRRTSRRRGTTDGFSRTPSGRW